MGRFLLDIFSFVFRRFPLHSILFKRSRVHGWCSGVLVRASIDAIPSTLTELYKIIDEHIVRNRKAWFKRRDDGVQDGAGRHDGQWVLYHSIGF